MGDKRETFETEETPRRGRKRRAKLVVTSEGADWSGVPDDERSDVLAQLLADEQTEAEFKAMYAAAPDGAGAGADIIKETHIELLLDVVQAFERAILPKLVARKQFPFMPVRADGTREPFIIEPMIAARAYTFTQEQRYGKTVDGKHVDGIVQPGVKAANQSLPPKIKALIAKVGPGSEFVGKLIMAIRDQQVNVLKMQIETIQQRAQHARRGPVRANGAGTEQHVAQPPLASPEVASVPPQTA